MSGVAPAVTLDFEGHVQAQESEKACLSKVLESLRVLSISDLFLVVILGLTL